jgi:hypothetical protein
MRFSVNEVEVGAAFDCEMSLIVAVAVIDFYAEPIDNVRGLP